MKIGQTIMNIKKEIDNKNNKKKTYEKEKQTILEKITQVKNTITQTAGIIKETENNINSLVQKGK